MDNSLHDRFQPGVADPEPPRVSLVEGWSLREYREVNSTSLIAVGLPAWSAVRADRQTAGRGRFQRSWVSDEGGLWLSAVVPVDLNLPAWQAFPLTVGLAVADALRDVGVGNLRMRWPNDLLAGNRKLAGLLIDQFKPGLAVAGIGINVTNHPEHLDHALGQSITRVADLVMPPPSLAELTRLVLVNLRAMAAELHEGGAHRLLQRVNSLWGAPRRVELDLDGELRHGTFSGVHDDGRLILHDENGITTAYHPWQVRHLLEQS